LGRKDLTIKVDEGSICLTVNCIADVHGINTSKKGLALILTLLHAILKKTQEHIFPVQSQNTTLQSSLIFKNVLLLHF
jgi:hypothetical protein